MRYIVSLVICFSFGFCKAQVPISILENSYHLKSNSEEVILIGLAQGDVLQFDFQELNHKSLKTIEFGEYNSAPFFKEFKAQSGVKELAIRKTGIYQIKLINENWLSRTVKIHLHRIPASEKTQNFNSQVYWKSVQDTVYEKKHEKYSLKKDTAVVSIVDQIAKISSRNALNGNDNIGVVDFTLPNNTISWGYYIGVGKEGKQEYEQAKVKALQSAVKIISDVSGYGAMAAIAMHGINLFNKAQGGDNVKYWFIQDENSVKAFRNKEKFYQYKQGDVINDASQMKKPLQGKIYIGLQNDNLIEPIEVFVKVTAITVTETKKHNTPKKYTLINKQLPYLLE